MIAITIGLAPLDDPADITDITDLVFRARGDFGLDQIGEGSFSVKPGVTLPVDPLPAFPARVICWFGFDGDLIPTIVTGLVDVVVDEGEEANQPVTYSFRGIGTVGDQVRVLPTLGADKSPWGPHRAFGVLSPPFDFSGWSAVEVYATIDDPTNPKFGFPDGFPRGDAYWIGPTEGDELQAPYGYHWPQTEFTLEDDSWVRFFYAVDDFGTLTIDGFAVIPVSTDRDPLSGFTKAHTADLYLSADTHRIGAKVINNFGDGDPGYGEGATVLGNPTMIACVGYLCDQLGQLGDVVVKSDSTWKCLSYPSVAPGMTDPQVIGVLLDEADGIGLDPAIVLNPVGSFDPVETITTPVGDSLLKYLKDRRDAEAFHWYFDIDGVDIRLNVLSNASVGSSSGVSYTTANKRLLHLETTKVDDGTTGLVVAWEGPQTFVGTGERAGFIKIPAETIGEAKAIAEAILARPNQPERVRATIRAVSGAIPGIHILPGQTVVVGSYTEQMVSWGFDWSDARSGEPIFSIEIKDRIKDRSDAIESMIARAAGGQMGGTAPSAPGGEPPEFGTKNDPRAFQFSIQPADDATTVPTGMVPATEYPTTNGNLYAFDIGATDLVGDITIDLYIGVTNVGTGTLTDSDPNGVITAYLDSYQTVYLTGGVSGARVDITSAPTSVSSLTVNGRVV